MIFEAQRAPILVFLLLEHMGKKWPLKPKPRHGRQGDFFQAFPMILHLSL